MHRRCIICGQEPGDHCVYPRNMTEARRWQNLANLSSFDVDTESLCRHGCVCSAHLDADHRGSSSESEGSSGAAEGTRTPAVLQESSVKWSSSGSGSVPGYPTNSRVVQEMQDQSKQSLSSERREGSSAIRCNNGFCRFRNACNSMFQGNPYNYQTQMGQNFANPQASSKLNRRENQSMMRNTSTRASPEGCTWSNCPAQTENHTRISAGDPYKATRNTSTRASPNVCTLANCPALRENQYKAHPRDSGSQESTKKTQRKERERPKSCERPSCSVVRKQRSEDWKPQGDDFRSLSSTQTWRSYGASKIPMNQINRIKKPELKNQCCQVCFNSHLKDREVQCSKVALQTQSSKPFGSFSYQTGSSFTGFSAGYTTNSSNFTYGGERKNTNAINVLLMNGTRNNDYDNSCCCPTNLRPSAPPPEICVQESDLTESNERAVFPEIDKPNYRVCRSANETNVLVLEEGPMDGCTQKAKGESDEAAGEAHNQADESNQNGIKEQQNDFVNNWLDCPAADNFTKVLELQRARIKELENLLQQHNLLQQTIQHKVAELQCTDNIKS
ncbi:uncharacterized protein [Drosophila takahashii]|uniref:uncharacterized protein n=1 Tax=Drosophila takahashii TaxID=29030 RepID=UPI001CF7FD70|nr:uncharacterized protein LOC108058741 [Drosophila takahashii]